MDRYFRRTLFELKCLPQNINPVFSYPNINFQDFIYLSEQNYQPRMKIKYCRTNYFKFCIKKIISAKIQNESAEDLSETFPWSIDLLFGNSLFQN